MTSKIFDKLADQALNAWRSIITFRPAAPLQLTLEEYHDIPEYLRICAMALKYISNQNIEAQKGTPGYQASVHQDLALMFQVMSNLIKSGPSVQVQRILASEANRCALARATADLRRRRPISDAMSRILPPIGVRARGELAVVTFILDQAKTASNRYDPSEQLFLDAAADMIEYLSTITAQPAIVAA